MIHDMQHAGWLEARFRGELADIADAEPSMEAREAYALATIADALGWHCVADTARAAYETEIVNEAERDALAFEFDGSDHAATLAWLGQRIARKQRIEQRTRAKVAVVRFIAGLGVVA
jgi:hypothetical protein